MSLGRDVDPRKESFSRLFLMLRATDLSSFARGIMSFKHSKASKHSLEHKRTELCWPSVPLDWLQSTGMLAVVGASSWKSDPWVTASITSWCSSMCGGRVTQRVSFCFPRTKSIHAHEVPPSQTCCVSLLLFLTARVQVQFHFAYYLWVWGIVAHFFKVEISCLMTTCCIHTAAEVGTVEKGTTGNFLPQASFCFYLEQQLLFHSGATALHSKALAAVWGWVPALCWVQAQGCADLWYSTYHPQQPICSEAENLNTADS